MNIRPTSITIVSWIMIVMGSLALVGFTIRFANPSYQELMIQNALPVPLQMAQAILGALVSIVSGAWMLVGRNWARILYVICTGLGFATSLLTIPTKSVAIPGIITYLLICFFVFRPRANSYFAATARTRI